MRLDPSGGGHELASLNVELADACRADACACTGHEDGPSLQSHFTTLHAKPGANSVIRKVIFVFDKSFPNLQQVSTWNTRANVSRPDLPSYRYKSLVV
jgi:hypothetical protein